jgi:hypothetical protein
MHHFFVLNLGLDIRILLRVPEILWKRRRPNNRPRTDFEAKFSIEISNPIKKKMLSINFTPFPNLETERLSLRRVDKMMPVPYSNYAQTSKR